MNQTIEQQLKLKPQETAAAFETALSKLERAEDNMRNLLAERRNKKLARLTPHPHTRKVTHTAHRPQRRGERCLASSLYEQGRERDQAVPRPSIHRTDDRLGPPTVL